MTADASTVVPASPTVPLAVIPAKAEIDQAAWLQGWLGVAIRDAAMLSLVTRWIPAFAGMTGGASTLRPLLRTREAQTR